MYVVSRATLSVGGTSGKCLHASGALSLFGISPTRAETNRRKHVGDKKGQFHISSSMLAGILAEACDLDQMASGCRISNAQCSCGYGCKSEYRYSSNEECRAALKGNETYGRI